MSRRTLEILPRIASWGAGTALVPSGGPFRYRLAGIPPVIAAPQVARHGGGGGGGGHGGGGWGGGGGHGGHHHAVSGGGGPGYPGPAGSGGGTDRKTVLMSLGFVALFITWLTLGLAHEIMAVVVIAAIIFGGPLVAVALLVLLALLAPLLPGRKR
jgi:hypothetical protein